MQEALRTYLELAMGLTEVSRKRVKKAVKDVVGQGDQIKTLTGDLLAASSANRESLVRLVRYEVDRALGAVGLATADEVAELTAKVSALQARLVEAEARAASVPTTEPAPAAPEPVPTVRVAVKKAPVKKAPVKKARVEKASVEKAPAKKAAVRKGAAPEPATAAPRPPRARKAQP
jgi:polyhydroxyalkanoate synthesis regulator phasin